MPQGPRSIRPRQDAAIAEAYAAGLLGQLQPDFAAGYGEMARLVARTFANYDRKDARFPFFRTFDIWRGHSFADGNGFPDGNNQESSSEAVNAWNGLGLWAHVRGDERMLEPEMFDPMPGVEKSLHILKPYKLVAREAKVVVDTRNALKGFADGSLGSTTAHNVVKATVDALSRLRTRSQILETRGKKRPEKGKDIS